MGGKRASPTSFGVDQRNLSGHVACCKNRLLGSLWVNYDNRSNRKIQRFQLIICCLGLQYLVEVCVENFDQAAFVARHNHLETIDQANLERCNTTKVRLCKVKSVGFSVPNTQLAVCQTNYKESWVCLLHAVDRTGELLC